MEAFSRYYKSDGQEEFVSDDFFSGQTSRQRFVIREPNIFPMMSGRKRDWVRIQKFGPCHLRPRHAAVVDIETKVRLDYIKLSRCYIELNNDNKNVLKTDVRFVLKMERNQRIMFEIYNAYT